MVAVRGVCRSVEGDWAGTALKLRIYSIEGMRLGSHQHKLLELFSMQTVNSL
jgi:hypothetical protein